MSLPYEVLPCICEVLDAMSASAAGAASRSWRHAVVDDDVLWRRCFALFWQNRQKSVLVRGWWQELLDCGVANPPELALTASWADAWVSNSWCLPNSLITKSDASKQWYRYFMIALADLQRTTLSVPELCHDVAHDDVQGGSGTIANRPFPRSWVLVAGALSDDFLGDELKFNSDFTISPRSCLLSIAPTPAIEWYWQLSDDGKQVAISYTFGETNQRFALLVSRARDGGFILRGPGNLILCSREKTPNEHAYRTHAIFRYPRCLHQEVEQLALGIRSTPFAFQHTLTSFERLVLHRLAESFGLQHDSHGTGLQRRIVIWKTGDAVQEAVSALDEERRRDREPQQ